MKVTIGWNCTINIIRYSQFSKFVVLDAFTTSVPLWSKLRHIFLGCFDYQGLHSTEHTQVRVALSYYIISYRIILYHIIPYHIISYLVVIAYV